MHIRLLIFFSGLLGAYVSAAQSPIQRLPENGGNGYNGSAPRSFIIQWDSLANTLYYEYVVSDNSLCFAGCTGDTRHDLVANNYSVESNLTLNKWYYWIVRAILKNGDTTFYSPIYSFYTQPRPEDTRSYFTLSPNLIYNESMTIQMAWTIDPDISVVDFKMYNSFGELMKSSESIFPEKNELKQIEDFFIDLKGFQPGLYFIELNTNKSKVPDRLKFIVSQ